MVWLREQGSIMLNDHRSGSIPVPGRGIMEKGRCSVMMGRGHSSHRVQSHVPDIRFLSVTIKESRIRP